MPTETKNVAELYLLLQDWDDVKAKVIDDDVLQKPTLDSRKRVFSELKKRLVNLTPQEMEHFRDASMDDVKVLSFVSCLKTYRLIYEFVFEVLRYKYLMFDYEIQSSDYNSFIESKEVSSPKLSSISETTSYKLKQVLFLILADIGLIESTKNHYITKPILSQTIIKILLSDDSKLLSALLMNNDEIAHYAKGEE
jgi:hypothetical protein